MIEPALVSMAGLTVRQALDTHEADRVSAASRRSVAGLITSSLRQPVHRVSLMPQFVAFIASHRPRSFWESGVDQADPAAHAVAVI